MPKINTQTFLDNNQYTESNIRNYEIIFGKQFVSTGGVSTTKIFTEMLNLKPDEYVLDFGTGLGGSACYMACHYGVNVLGVDVSQNMISRANEFVKDLSEEIRRKVKLELCDGTNMDIPNGTFDCIYTRETLLYIQDKPSLLKKFHKWLKPGGRLLISEYCLGNHDAFTDGFIQYTKAKNYFMKTIPDYASLIEQAGFRNVKAQDLTQNCIKILNKDLESLYVHKHSILNEMTRCEYDKLFTTWDLKLQRCANGDQTWGLLTAMK